MQIWWCACVITFFVFALINPVAGLAFFVGLMAMDARYSISEIERLCAMSKQENTSGPERD